MVRCSKERTDQAVLSVQLDKI